MKDKVRIKVLLPATSELYEFRMPFDITVEQGARLVSRLLSSREPIRYESSDDVDMVLIDGGMAGELLNPKETFRGLVLSEQIVDGSAVMLA